MLDAAQAADPAAWKQPRGRWSLQNGALKPGAPNVESWTTIGDTSWTDYTIQVKARKIGGREGFLVLWHSQADDTYHWWNIGGWGNTIARCETSKSGDRQPYGPSVPFVVETDRWYDLRLEVSGNRVRGYVDGKLVTDTTETPEPDSPAVSASATYATREGVLIVKVVNAGPTPVNAAVRLSGAKSLGAKGVATVLSGEPTAVNTLEQPKLVAPKTETVSISGDFRRTFPAHSLTVLRIPAKRR